MPGLRIHHVVPSLTVGGIDTMIRNLAPLQVRAGHQVSVHATLAVGPSAVELKRQHVPVSQVRGPHPLHSLIKLARLFRQQQPHVVHCHNYPSTVVAAPAARLAGVPCVICTWHRSEREWPPGRERRFWFAARFCHRVVAVSRFAAAVLAGSPWASPAKICVIHNGVARPAAAERGPAADHPSGLLKLISVARLDPIKDFPTLLRAMASALPYFPGLRLWILGDGAEKTRLENLIAELNLSQTVELLGYRQDVGNWLARSDVFVLSSVRESLPFALLEALALGVPAVVTDAGGMPEVARCCGAGVVVPPARPDALAAAILDLARDPSRRHSLAERAIACYSRHFTPERMAAQYEELYVGILQSKHHPDFRG